ncbi:MAG: hypothetical protein ABSG43_20605 [Solirubrobacteraceae bacterium]
MPDRPRGDNTRDRPQPDLGTVLGSPALLAGLTLVGRYRRAYRTQTEQAEALLAETRRAVRALRADTPPLPDALAALPDDRPGALTVSGEPYALSPAAGLALLRVAKRR